MTTLDFSKGTIIRQKDKSEFYTPEDCYILEIYNSPDDQGLSVARARVLPGHTTKWHRLRGTVERYYILDGKGLVQIGDEPPRQVGPGDMVLIPEMMPQRIKNQGDTDLIFLCICTPRFTPEVYEPLE